MCRLRKVRFILGVYVKKKTTDYDYIAQDPLKLDFVLALRITPRPTDTAS